jgi:heterotetrameric sarcosine oxidase gamma subunit
MAEARFTTEPCAIVQAESWPGTSMAFEAELSRQLGRFEAANVSEPPLPAFSRGEGKGEGLGEGHGGEGIREIEAQRPSPSPSPYLSPQAGRGVVGVASHSADQQKQDAPSARLPSAFGEVVRTGAWQVIRIAPRRFWLITDKTSGLPWSIDPELGCIVSLSESRKRLKLSGPHTLDILAACVAIDWNAPEAQPGRAVQTSFHHVPVLVLRNAAETCDILVPRSFAHSLAAWVTEVAAPYRARRLVTA